MIPLDLTELTTIAELESLRPEWSVLWQAHPAATPFQSPEWLLPWWRHLGGGDLRVITLRSAGKLVGMAPLFLHYWEGKRQLSPLGVSISDYSAFLILPPFERVGTELILEHLSLRGHEWQVCVMPEVPEGAPLLSVSIPDGLSARKQPSNVCPVIALPQTIDEYPSTLSAHRYRDIRRGWRSVQAKGGNVERADAATLQESMDALFHWHTARWQARGQSGMLATPELQAFHREAAAGLEACGALRLYGLRVQGTLRAILHGFASGERVSAYLEGFDPSIASSSPVHLLMWAVIQDAIREGYREFDLLRGQEPHKYVWGARDRQNVRLTLYSGAR